MTTSPHIIEVRSTDDAGLDLFARLTETQLRNRLEPEKGVFIAESPKVIAVALDAGYQPVALLTEHRHIEGDAREIIRRCGDIPIYTGDSSVLERLTGFHLTRGVLCAMRRAGPRPLEEVCRDKKRLAVLDGVVDATNVGAIFRSAAALGMDGLLLTPSCCDPLNRRAVRVSMGTVFQIPWTFLCPCHGNGHQPAFDRLHEFGFQVAAMALRPDALRLDDPSLQNVPQLAIVMGAEGDGLADAAIDSCDFVVRIPMFHGVDSLNVAAASAVAFWQLKREC